MVMHNDFVLVGPKADSAGVSGTRIAEAFHRIAHTESPFVSRGDESGTHMKEKQIWEEAEAQPEGKWYLRAGSGMAAALRMANEKAAYTLSDRGTFLALRNGLELVVISQGEPILRNQYAVIVVSSQKHPHAHVKAARQLVEFLGSPRAQAVIRDFGVAEFGEPLFFVNERRVPEGTD